MRAVLLDPSNFTPYYDYYLCRALRQSGCDARLFTSRFIYEELPFAGDHSIDYHFYRLPPARAANPALRHAAKAAEHPLDLVALLPRLLGARPDVVHFQWLLAPRLELPLATLLRRLGCRLVYTVHNVQPHEGRPIPAALYRRIGATMDAIIVHSESAQRELSGVLGGQGAKIHAVPHGILFGDQAPLGRIEARRRLSLPSFGRLILFFGLIEPYKGLDCLLRALTKVVRALPEAKLVVAGRPGAGFASSLALIDDLGISGHVVFHLDYVPSAEVASYFCAADVVALPYLRASQSGVLLTAYHFGRPVVVTNTGALGETVAGDGTGLVVEPGDPEALAEALLSLLGDPVAAARMAEGAREAARIRYDWRQIAAQTIAVYRAAREVGQR